MKVMHVLNSRIYSGAEKVVSQIIKAFEKGEQVQMVYVSPQSDIVARMLDSQNITYIPIDSLTPGNLRKVILEEKPDLIHAHDMRAGFVASLCCGKIPVVSHIHNNAFDARKISPKSVAYLLAGFKAKHILWVSRSAYEGYVFQKLFARKSQVLPNILDLEQIAQKKAQDGNTYDFDLIYVGRLTYEKNPQRLMRLCASLKENKPDVKLAVVGTGELEEELKALCIQLGIQDNVQFLGFQSNPIRMIADSKALVLTSLWEGTPMCALEAMAVGTPVVSTPSDGLKDLIDNGVHGYLHEEDEDLARSLLKILLDPHHRQELSRNALAKSQIINDLQAYKQVILSCYR